MNTWLPINWITTNLTALTSAEKKKLPFYVVTADPFGAITKWENLCNDEDFINALRWVVDLNTSAIKQNEVNSGWNHVHYGFENPKKPLQLHGADISLMALMLSLEDTMKAQENVVSRIWFICWSDLSNLRELFETVSQSKPRSYHNTIVQMLDWFYQVRYQYYDFDSRSVREEEFCDFERIGGSPDGIREWIKNLHNGKLYLEVWREIELILDFRNATTELVIKHWNFRKHEILEAIQRNNPFANQDRANILFPLGTAWWTLPLINLTKITFEHWNGKEKERLNFEWIKNPQLQSAIRWGVHGILSFNNK